MPSASLNMNTYWSNIKISSCSSLWKLDYFFDMAFLRSIFNTRKILGDKPFVFFFLNLANHIELFSVISKLDMEPRYILLNINPIPIREVSTKAFPVWVFYVIEKVCVLKSYTSVGHHIWDESMETLLPLKLHNTCHKNYVDSTFMYWSHPQKMYA